MSLTSMLYFLGASVLLTLAPGPDNTFVIALGLSRGRKAAVITALGMCSGISVHTTAAALGISAILYSSAWAFSLLKYAGAVYLLYLAYKAVKEQSIVLAGDTGTSARTAQLFHRGVIMNVLNPKVALFFLAFLPQFVSPDGIRPALQMMVLGLVFMAQAVIIFSAIGLLSGSVGNFILKRPQLAKYFSWLSAVIFASLGLRLAVAGR
ncbi:MAG: Homoserine/homoserine lactone efflux protein [Candidatus Hydrogenedentes bacterium ADurb.Bin179]|nr:MAG: Homoserine/homoserine lactone efflux protein [Candidatus Hydrogenedentes bacterium ADurb.Bin179]